MSRPYWPKHSKFHYTVANDCQCQECLDYWRVTDISTAWDMAIDEDARYEVEALLTHD